MENTQHEHAEQEEISEQTDFDFEHFHETGCTDGIAKLVLIIVVASAILIKLLC